MLLGGGRFPPTYAITDGIPRRHRPGGPGKIFQFDASKILKNSAMPIVAANELIARRRNNLHHPLLQLVRCENAWHKRLYQTAHMYARMAQWSHETEYPRSS